MDAVDVSCDVKVNTSYVLVFMIPLFWHHRQTILGNIINLSSETMLWTQIPEVLYVRNR